MTLANDLLAVHATIAEFGGDTGLTPATIAELTGLIQADLQQALTVGAARGLLSRIDGRWVAWDICPTCGYGTDDRYASTDHPGGVCETHPVDYLPGYPTTVNA